MEVGPSPQSMRKTTRSEPSDSSSIACSLGPSSDHGLSAALAIVER